MMGAAAAIASPASTAKRTRPWNSNSAARETAAIPTPMQLRISTLVISSTLAWGRLATQLVKRNRNAMPRM